MVAKFVFLECHAVFIWRWIMLRWWYVFSMCVGVEFIEFVCSFVRSFSFLVCGLVFSFLCFSALSSSVTQFWYGYSLYTIIMMPEEQHS